MEQRSELHERAIEYPSLIFELKQSMKERSQFIDHHHIEYQDDDGFKNKIEFRATIPQVKTYLLNMKWSVHQTINWNNELQCEQFSRIWLTFGGFILTVSTLPLQWIELEFLQRTIEHLYKMVEEESVYFE